MKLPIAIRATFARSKQLGDFGQELVSDLRKIVETQFSARGREIGYYDASYPHMGDDPERNLIDLRWMGFNWVEDTDNTALASIAGQTALATPKGVEFRHFVEEFSEGGRESLITPPK